MGTSKGTLKYGYKVRIELENLVLAIADKIYGELDEWYLDDELIMEMRHETKYEAWYCRATLESPEENEVECDEMIDETDVVDAILNAMHSMKKEDIQATLEVDDESDWDFPEYDPYDDNDAYDRWRDAYYDREYAERGE